MPGKPTRYHAPLAAMLLSAACAGCAVSTPTPVPTATPTPLAAPTPAAVELPTVTPTTAPATATGPVVAVEDAPAVNSYRLRVQTQSETARGTDVVEITGGFIKQPRAETVTVTTRQGDRTEELAMIQVHGARYIRVGDLWVTSSGGDYNLAELTLITAADSAALVPQMAAVGPDTVDDRPAVHYRGGKEIIPVVGPAGDTLDVSRLAAAQLDVWVDTALQVVSRFVLTGSGGADEPALRFSVTYEYTDFNADIVVIDPMIPAVSVAAPTEEFVPRNELAALLGFNLLFPTGSTVEVVGTALYIVVNPYTLDEAASFIELTLPANGYTLLSKTGPLDGQIVYLFQLGQKIVSVALEDLGDGTTRFRFAAGP